MELGGREGWPLDTLVELLETSSEAFGANPALLIKPSFRYLVWSYADLWNDSGRVASFLQDQGVEKGDRILLWGPNMPQWVLGFFGALRAGAIPVPLDVRSAPDFVSRVVEQTEPRLAFVSRAGQQTASEDLLSGLLSVPIEDLDQQVAGYPSNPTDVEVKPDDLAEIMFTSGTTGDPKGVKLTHRNILSNAQAVTGYGASGPDKLKPGFDPLFQSMSGTTARQGASAERPVFLRTPVCDDTNAMLLAAGVLMALHHRDHTGQGQKIDLSLLKTGALINSDDFMRFRGKEDRPLADNGLYGLSAVKRLYKAADGWIFLDCNQAEERESLRDFLDESLGESWLGDAVTFDEANKMHPWNQELCGKLCEEFERRPADDWEQRLVAAGVPCCRVAKDIDEGFYLHPQALHLGMIDENVHPEYSNLRQAGVQVLFSETPSANRRPAPSLGQHTAEILQELGFSGLEISDMRAARCIGVPGIS